MKASQKERMYRSVNDKAWTVVPGSKVETQANAEKKSFEKGDGYQIEWGAESSFVRKQILLTRYRITIYL